ncbi:response regulator [Segetibacter sp. 3557_3]|uniref:response regulator n=1 Tax=Segetibacter sp. 3557_3 TaxID=2547429 RepID=UPI0010584DE6|nr:response regulator [Segetibacter sp. 3557_3]TDH20853.1 response regulator [Segetibacter sp. 3557_3]
MSTNKISHIVMADDDEDDFEFFRSAAEKACRPLKVSHAANWIELTRYLDREPMPDLVFLDLNMPVKNGLECLQLIRADRKYDGVGVFIYSTSSAKKDIEDTYKHNANHYIVKPDKYEEISRLVETICEMDAETLKERPEKSNYIMK